MKIAYRISHLPFRQAGIAYRKRSFTLVELIITITLIGIVLIPLGLMSLEFIRGIVYAKNLGVVEGLVKIEMAKVNNLSFADPTLADGYDHTASNYEGYAFDLRRTVNFANSPANTLKKVQVRVYPAGNSTDFLANVITYVANVYFGAGSGGGAATEDEANSLTVSGGSISGKKLQNVALQNTSSISITITGVIISFTGQSGIKLKEITLGGEERWDGDALSDSTITLATNFTLSANTTYTNTDFLEFNKDLTSVTSLVFIMSDGSHTPGYSW